MGRKFFANLANSALFSSEKRFEKSQQFFFTKEVQHHVPNSGWSTCELQTKCPLKYQAVPARQCPALEQSFWTSEKKYFKRMKRTRFRKRINSQLTNQSGLNRIREGGSKFAFAEDRMSLPGPIDCSFYWPQLHWNTWISEYIFHVKLTGLSELSC
jgi:hypothetical protein